MNRFYHIFQISLSVQRICVRHSDQYAIVRFASTSSESKSAVKKNAADSPKITLIALNKSVTITSLNEAQKLAKRRDLQLVQIADIDAKTRRPVYKLATSAESMAEAGNEISRSAEREKRIHMKSLTIGSRISDHDLGARLKSITKWLEKQNEIRVLVQGSAEDAANNDRIVKTIEECIKVPDVIGKIVQKRTKCSAIQFHIIPVKFSSDAAGQA